MAVVVDASCLYDLVTRTARHLDIRRVLSNADEVLAPHVVDVEVLGVIRREAMLGHFDDTAAKIYVDRLRSWPGHRIGHQPLLFRAWELRHTVRGWDAMYVALAEAVDATLITADQRLARASGPRCRIEVV